MIFPYSVARVVLFTQRNEKSCLKTPTTPAPVQSGPPVQPAGAPVRSAGPYGQPVPTPEQQAQAKKAKTLSIVSLVSGIVGLFIFGYILGIVAIVTGRLAMNNPELKSRGMAIAGTVLGIVGIVLMIVLRILVKQ